MITDPAYKAKQEASKAVAAERAALPVVLRNFKKVYDAGIPVVLGTDSGGDGRSGRMGLRSTRSCS